MPTSVFVVARDHQALRDRLAQRTFRALGAKLGCSASHIGHLSVNPRKRISLDLATRLETELGAQPGELFVIDGETAHATGPYLPVEANR